MGSGIHLFVLRVPLLLFLVGFGLGTTIPCQAQEENQAQEAASPDIERPRYRAPKLNGEVRIDGRIDEAAWDGASLIELGFEYRPGENIDAPVRTEALLGYDENHLYVAFRAFDPDPKAIRAHITDRDTAWNDDWVGVIFDTFNDERRGYEMFVNPFGVQMDLSLNDLSDGDNEDASWNAIWDSAGRITEEGFEVEMAIPFSSLRFQRVSGEQEWSMTFLRTYPRNVQHKLSDSPIRREISCLLCQIGKVTGFEDVAPGRNLELTPTLTALRADASPSLGAPVEKSAEDLEPGLTAKWGVTPNLTLSGTINPDFSQVEADSPQLDINNQFALFFPERRPFFLEGADFFSTPINAVFTRNVADPSFGAKLTGKVGPNAIGLFVAQDETTNLLFPGSQGSDTTTLDQKTTDTVFRYRRDMGSGSAIGVLYTGREGDGYYNRVAGIDTFLRISDRQTLRMQGLASATQYPSEVANEFDQPAGELDGSAFTVAYNYDTRGWFGYARLSSFAEDFRADMGFLPQVDSRKGVLGAQKVFFGEKGDGFRRIAFGGDIDKAEDQDGNLLEQESELFFNYEGPFQSFVFVGLGEREVVFEGVSFDQQYQNFYGNIRPIGDVRLELDYSHGDAIDFANIRPGTQTSIEPEIDFHVGRRLRIGAGHSYRTLDVEEGRLFTANLSELRAVYQFNLRTFVRLTAQRVDIARDSSLYLDPVDSRSEDIFGQLLFSYKVNPQTVLFLGYSESHAADELIDLNLENQTVFFKVSYAWLL